eukprot:scaffold1927_cov333-Pavlova_lutheri.AAC.17
MRARIGCVRGCEIPTVESRSPWRTVSMHACAPTRSPALHRLRSLGGDPKTVRSQPILVASSLHLAIFDRDPIEGVALGLLQAFDTLKKQPCSLACVEVFPGWKRSGWQSTSLHAAGINEHRGAFHRPS